VEHKQPSQRGYIMAFSFQYFVGEIKQLSAKDHQGRTIYNQFTDKGSHHQTTNKALLYKDIAQIFADSHILGKNHIKTLNSLANPLYGFRLVNNTELIATLTDKTELNVRLADGQIIVNQLKAK
jgi:hypothetical protein